MSRAQLARKLGYKSTRLYRYISGKIPFSQPALKKTAEFLELPKKQAIKLAGYDFYEEKRRETLTDLIKLALDENGTTIKDLARKLGYKSTRLYRYISGRSTFPRPTLKKIAEFLELDLDQVMKLFGYRKRPMRSLKDLIQSALDEKGITKAQLARELGYNEMTYSGYVAGRSKFLQQALAQTITYLNISAEEVNKFLDYDIREIMPLQKQDVQQSSKNLGMKTIKDLETITEYFGFEAHDILSAIMPEAYTSSERIAIDKMITGRGKAGNNGKWYKRRKRLPKDPEKRLQAVTLILAKYEYNEALEVIRKKALQEFKPQHERNQQRTLKKLEKMSQQTDDPLYQEILGYVRDTLTSSSKIIPLNNSRRYLRSVRVRT